MYINLWYVAAFSSELNSAPVKVRMLNRDFVLFRDADGKAHCLSNVCPHRGVSLAQGKCLEDGTLQCPQHGWQFAGDGLCRSIPSQDDGFEMPPGARVDSYPTEERHGLIWTFLGDSPDTAPPIPDMPEIETPGWRTLEVRRSLERQLPLGEVREHRSNPRSHRARAGIHRQLYAEGERSLVRMTTAFHRTYERRLSSPRVIGARYAKKTSTSPQRLRSLFPDSRSRDIWRSAARGRAYSPRSTKCPRPSTRKRPPCATCLPAISWPNPSTTKGIWRAT